MAALALPADGSGAGQMTQVGRGRRGRSGANSGHLPNALFAREDESRHDDIHDPKGHVMNETLTLSPQRMIRPVVVFVMAIAVAAALALGFGLRTWTEDSGRPSAPAGAVHAPAHSGPVSPQPLRKLGQPF
jgi:hypothetical protein